MADTTTSSSGTSGSSGASFCNAEERISTNICDALHPAIAFDISGNRGVAWHDDRNGPFEIYFKILGSLLAPIQITPAGSMQCTDPSSSVSGSSGFSGNAFPLSSRCASSGTSGSSGATGIIATIPGGLLDVNPNAMTAYLTATDGSTNFLALGVGAGTVITIGTGKNATLQFTVLSVVSPTVLALAYVPQAVADVNFVYSIVSEASGAAPDTCESRITCSNATSVFPSVVSTDACKYHVAYHSNKSGSDQIWYVQVASSDVISNGCAVNGIPVFGTSFGEASGTAADTFVFRSSNPPVVTTFQVTGAVGQFFAFGNRMLPAPTPSNGGDASSTYGLHDLYRDWNNQCNKRFCNGGY